MTEREMEDLIWEHPEKFLNEALIQFQRQPTSSIGRADLIFLDRIGRLIVIELKRDTLGRDALPQIVDYLGMLKARFPDKSVELILIANHVPRERKLACEIYNVEAREIPEKKFRDVAEEVGYVFKSEMATPPGLLRNLAPESEPNDFDELSTLEDFRAPSKIEKSWYFWKAGNGEEYFLACVNAKGSCSMRRFKADDGTFLGREYKAGDYQKGFSRYLKTAVPVLVTTQPNLERDCKNRLPSFVLTELRQQIFVK